MCIDNQTCHTMDDIIQGCREICKQTCAVKVNVVRALSDTGIDVFSIPGLEDTLLKIPDPFVGLETPYMCERFINNECIMG